MANTDNIVSNLWIEKSIIDVSDPSRHALFACWVVGLYPKILLVQIVELSSSKNGILLRKL